MNDRRRHASDAFLAFLGVLLLVYLLLCFVSCSTPRGVLTSQKDSVRTVITDRIVGLDRHRNMDNCVSIHDALGDHSPDGVFLGLYGHAGSAAGDETQEQIY